MTSLDTLLDMDDALPIQRQPQESPVIESPGEFLEHFNRISARLPNNDLLECLKPYWSKLQKALSVITESGDLADNGWRLRFEKPYKPTPFEIEERVVLFVRDAMESLPCLPDPDEDQEGFDAEQELLRCITKITCRFVLEPRLLTEADQSEISDLRKAAIEYSR